MSHVIIGTAGHIDHGKTALVKALTGVDTDRLKDEKARGLTIDLGFAHIGDRATIIDVPGHEKFIRNMVAGVSTIDLVLFVVAADDGVMPQTREHLDILKILGIKKGIIAITKTDLVEEEWFGLVKEEVRNLVQDTFLASAPIIPASSTTGEGISDLKSELENELANLKLERDRGMFWMPVDRSFSMKGFGTVVTGSVLAGETHVGNSLELLPHQKPVKIRGLQTHNESVEKVTAGDRAAINLQAVEKQQIQRGDVLAEANYFTPSRRMDAKVELLSSAPKTLKSNARIRLHIGTTEVMARIAIFSQKKIDPGKSAHIQFHLEKPACSRRLDPFVIRQYSPMTTIGGGTILNPNAPKHKLSDPKVLEELSALEKENPEEVIEHKLLSANFTSLTVERIASEIAVPKDTTQQILQDLENQDKVVTISKNAQASVVHRNMLDKLVELIKNTLTEFHKKNPTKLGLNKNELAKSLKPNVDGELLDYVLTDLKNSKLLKETEGSVSLYDHTIDLAPALKTLRDEIDNLLYEEGFNTSSVSEMASKLKTDPKSIQEALSYMLNAKEVIRVEGDIYFHAKRIQEAREKLVSHLNKNEKTTVSEFKELLNGASRKYALPLLIYFDSVGLTERDGDVRILR